MDSSYYRDLRNKQEDKADEYEKNIKELQKIIDDIYDDFYDDIRDVNGKVDNLRTDLKKGVRHNSTFTRRANSLLDNKEKAASADPKLKLAIIELNEEIARLRRLKRNAEEKYDQYDREYENKKDEEQRELMNKLLGR